MTLLSLLGVKHMAFPVNTLRIALSEDMQVLKFDYNLHYKDLQFPVS